ncbi:MAG: iron-containing alcohol dehydrogenase [Acholeplasmatales bacterium]|nr:iron-containing alcohol dehydrogenase [Acholeplasmatales bacterium]
MNKFNYYTPTKVFFGEDRINELGDILKSYNINKLLLVYGGGSIKKSGLYTRIGDILEDNNIKCFELKGVEPNPLLSKVNEGINIVKKNDIDFLLAVGGGSVIDTAKAIGYGAYNSGDVWDFYAKKRKPEGSLKIGVVLTISAAGSEMSDSSVITNDDTKEKRGCNSNYCRPLFAIMDPKYTTTLPDNQTMAGCCDIIMHTMERYFTKGGNLELTDEIAEGLMRTVFKNGTILHEDPTNLDARAEVMWASSLSHNGLTGCGNDGGDFMSHKLEHELSGKYNVTHGAGLSIIWPAWAEYVYMNNLDRFYKYAKNVLGIDGTDKIDIAKKGIRKTKEIFSSWDLPIKLRELDIYPSYEDIEEMAKSCYKSCGGPKGSSRILDLDDMINIYTNAL